MAAPKEQDIIMIRPHMRDLPEHSLPPGYEIRPIGPGDVAAWTEIWREAENNPNLSGDKFYKEFGKDWTTIAARCFLLVDAGGHAVGTASAWFNRDFRGQDYGRVHWVAIRPRTQGRGLSKPLMSFIMRRLAERHERCYLVTHVHRLAAVKLYLDFGFAPDLSRPEDRERWRTVRARLPHPALARLDGAPS